MFATLWCGLTGMGVYETVRTIARCVDAQRRFVPADAVILDSRLVRAGKRSRRLEVTFSYDAGGRKRTSVGPAFGSVSSGDPAAYPVGVRSTAWVDPERPEVAVLDRRVPEDTWFHGLLLQPFLTIGVGFLVMWVRWPFQTRRERAFLRADRVRPGLVPGWGVLSESSGAVLSIHRPSPAIFVAVAAWGLSTFAAAFLLGMLSAGFGFSMGAGLPVARGAAGGRRCVSTAGPGSSTWGRRRSPGRRSARCGRTAGSTRGVAARSTAGSGSGCSTTRAGNTC